MIELKNCPNCGGVLDDTGRCMYCKSKVYDLTDVNIDLDTMDILVFKLKHDGQEIIFNAYPRNFEIEYQPSYNDIEFMNGRHIRTITSEPNMDLHIDFSMVKMKNGLIATRREL